MQNIKWIFFDVGSTLVNESMVYERRMKKIAEHAGVSYEYVYNTAVDFYKKNKKGDLEVIKQLHTITPEWESDYEILYCDTESCLRELHNKYKIGVIANQTLGTKERLEKLGISKYIDLVIASAEEGFEKPDERIFYLALNRAYCNPNEAVMIGDRIDNDICPAKKIGMKTIWVKQGFGKYWSISNNDEKADFEVDNLTYINNIL